MILNLQGSNPKKNYKNENQISTTSEGLKSSLKLYIL